ncbi:MAG: restriction endonuclease [Ignavibacteriales bacterium]|nr:restriction endonuclease [Ignavibacteriales bacterium]
MLTSPGSGDKEVDILLRFNGQKIIVQCKKHFKPINPNFVRELAGTLVNQHADFAFLVSLSGFSTNCHERFKDLFI